VGAVQAVEVAMTPADFRNATFDSIRAGLNDRRRVVYEAWLAHGPGTTRLVADRAGLDILSFRPRSTELFKLGLLVLAEVQVVPGNGIYRAADIGEWEKFKSDKLTGQLELL
jgi:hypothetical protein